MSAPLKVLSLLDAYEERQQEAQKLWKKSQWNLTKAKQSKGSANAVTATNVREELRPRCVLVKDDIPKLVKDEDKKKSSSSSSALPYFRVVDPVEHEQLDKENAATASPPAAAAAATDDNHTSGLRNRKAKESSSETKKEWIVTQEEDNSNLVIDEETRLRSLDPIDLFGLPTRELRLAKQEAQRAVALYVEAANLLLSLQQEMKK